MAAKATIFKAELERSDLDQGFYTSHSVTLARHPSENDERMMARLLAFTLFAPADDGDGALEFGKGISDQEEPDLWRRDLTGQIKHWIEIGEPDERRVSRAAGRADRVSILGYRGNFPSWWEKASGTLARAENLDVWHVDSKSIGELTKLAGRTMRLTATLQEGTVWVANDAGVNVQLSPVRLR